MVAQAAQHPPQRGRQGRQVPVIVETAHLQHERVDAELPAGGVAGQLPADPGQAGPGGGTAHVFGASACRSASVPGIGPSCRCAADVLKTPEQVQPADGLDPATSQSQWPGSGRPRAAPASLAGGGGVPVAGAPGARGVDAVLGQGREVEEGPQAAAHVVLQGQGGGRGWPRQPLAGGKMRCWPCGPTKAEPF